MSEEVKSAASYALGSICIGNLQQYLPFILKESQDSPKKQYLLLHSLKEVGIGIMVPKILWKFGLVASKNTTAYMNYKDFIKKKKQKLVMKSAYA